MPDANQQLNQIVLAPILSRAVCSMAELGIPDQIPKGGSKSVTELAAEVQCDERTLYRVMRFLASHGVFEEGSEKQFALTPLAEALREDAPNSFRPAARMFRDLYHSLSEFEYSLRTGESALTRAVGQPLFEYLSSHPEQARIFDGAMTALHGAETPAMLDAYDFAGIDTLADVGGGNGSLLIETLRRNEKLKGMLYDLAHVAGNARRNIDRAGLGDRCRVEEGSFFEAIPQGADAYLLRHIIHDWSDQESIRILRNVRQAVPTTGRILIVEPVIPPGNDPSPSKDMDIAMLLFPGGMERTENEYRALFSQAGFELTRVTPTASPVSVVEGRPV